MKIGDRVIAIEEYDGNSSIVDKHGTILYIDKCSWTDHYIYTVQFDDCIEGGHRGTGGTGLNGHCWNLEVQCLKLENQYIVELI